MRIKFAALQCAVCCIRRPNSFRPRRSKVKLRGAPLLFINRSSNVQPPFPAN